MEMYNIHAYASIVNESVTVNGTCVFQSENTSFSDFSKSFYKDLGCAYPKFFKMDDLSKLAFLTAEVLLNEQQSSAELSQTAIVFANKSASLDTDVHYQSSIQSKDAYYPSPAVFVYTLPNICIGEISIRHKLLTESAFFVQDTFDIDFMHAYAESLLNSGQAAQVLCGWVEFFDNTYHSFLYLVAKDGVHQHTPTIIKNFYQQ